MSVGWQTGASSMASFEGLGIVIRVILEGPKAIRGWLELIQLLPKKGRKPISEQGMPPAVQAVLTLEFK